MANLNQNSDSLEAIATKHGTDKWNSHWYAKHYAYHLQYLRDRKFNLLEVGVGGYHDPHKGGESLRAWKEYFPLANIVGLDIFDKSPHAEDRIQIFQGSQCDPVAVTHMLNHVYGNKLDVIVDDGSHRNEHTITTFLMLWQYLSTDGWYIIEDLQTSYWPSYGGKAFETASPYTAMGFFKALIDGLNFHEIHQPTYSPSTFDQTIVGMHFYHNLLFIKKGLNNEGSTEVSENRIRGV